MLAKRLIEPVSIRDRPWIRGGQGLDARQQAQASDELMLMGGAEADHASLMGWLGEASGRLFHPVVVWAGEPSVREIDELMRAGAARVLVWAAVSEALLKEAADRWGSESIGLRVGLPREPGTDGRGLAASGDPHAPAMSLEAVAARCASGAGELLVTDDGVDLADRVPTLRAVVDRVEVPVVVAGRVTTTGGLRRVLVDAGVCGLVFEPHRIEQFETVAELKTYLAAAGIMVRGV